MLTHAYSHSTFSTHTRMPMQRLQGHYTILLHKLNNSGTHHLSVSSCLVLCKAALLAANRTPTNRPLLTTQLHGLLWSACPGACSTNKASLACTAGPAMHGICAASSSHAHTRAPRSSSFVHACTRSPIITSSLNGSTLPSRSASCINSPSAGMGTITLPSAN